MHDSPLVARAMPVVAFFRTPKDERPEACPRGVFVGDTMSRFSK